MKTRISVAIASLLLASLGTTAYAQGAQQTTPEQSTPTSSYMSQSTTNDASNSSITSNVQRQLRNKGISTSDVTVSVQSGTATLRGTVNSQSDLSKAKSAAMQVAGVTNVNTSGLHVQGDGQNQWQSNQSASTRTASNRIQSSAQRANQAMSNQDGMDSGMSNSSMSGDQITRKVKDELQSHEISTSDVSVVVRNGTVTLRGTVASQSDIRKAMSAAMQVAGVKHVNTSGLRVKGHSGNH